MRQAGCTVELERDVIRRNEARVRLVTSGVCHTDAIVRDGVYPTPFEIGLSLVEGVR